MPDPRQRRSPKRALLLCAGLFAAIAAPVACGARAELLGPSAAGEGGHGGSGTVSSSSSGVGGQGGAMCTPEVCDGVDNNCDGVIDEGCDCLPGMVVACYSGPPGTEGLGACKAGQKICGAGGQFGPCAGEVLPAPEACNDIDDDCNGLVDENCGCAPGEVFPCYPGAPGTLGVGPCAAGKQVCDANGFPGPCMGAVLPLPEVCNGVDDDCNGVVDDGLGTFTCGVGACTTTAPACQGGKPGNCVPLPPSPEKCDGIDNDCDGTIDNGCSPGCADGTREGFVDAATHPHIAACSGGWTVPGLLGALQPTCGHLAGNDSPNPGGAGCSAADLCAPGFHVCSSAADVAASSPTGCTGAAAGPNLFFATRQSSTGCSQCALGTNTDPSICNGCSCAVDCAQTTLTANDVFGCGSLGDSPPVTCGVLTRFSNDLCTALGPPWSCGNDGCGEAGAVTKPASARGGVLCCAD